MHGKNLHVLGKLIPEKILQNHPKSIKNMIEKKLFKDTRHINITENP